MDPSGWIYGPFLYVLPLKILLPWGYLESTSYTSLVDTLTHWLATFFNAKSHRDLVWLAPPRRDWHPIPSYPRGFTPTGFPSRSASKTCSIKPGRGHTPYESRQTLWNSLGYDPRLPPRGFFPERSEMVCLSLAPTLLPLPKKRWTWRRRHRGRWGWRDNTTDGEGSGMVPPTMSPPPVHRRHHIQPQRRQLDGDQEWWLQRPHRRCSSISWVPGLRFFDNL